MVSALESLSASHIHNVYLTTWEANLGAQKLYTKHAFEKVGQIPELGSDGTINGYEHIMLRQQ